MFTKEKSCPIYCEYCGEFIGNDDEIEVYPSYFAGSLVILCPECEESLTNCDHCDENYMETDMMHIAETGENVCPECYALYERDN